MNKKLVILRHLFLILTGIAIGLSSSCNYRDDDAVEHEVYNFAAEVARADSGALKINYMPVLDSLQLRNDEDFENLYKTVHSMARHMLSSGDHLKAIDFLSNVKNALGSSYEGNKLRTNMLLTTYICLGAAYSETGMPGIGLDCYTKGLGIASDSIYDIKRAQLYNNIAVLYHLSSHLDKAEHYYLKALDINLRRDIRTEIFLNYNNLAELYDKFGRIPDALDASLRGLQYVDANKQPEYFYGTHIFLGTLYTRTGDLDMAASYISNGTSKLKDINFVPGLVDAYQAYSRYFMVRGKSDSAEVYARKALELSRESALYPLEESSLEVLAESYAAAGNNAAAVRCLIDSDNIKDSVRNQENRIRLTEWENRSGIETLSPEPAYSRTSIFFAIIIAIAALRCTALLAVIFLRRRADWRSQKSELVSDLERLNRELIAESIDKIKTREGMESICEDLRTLLRESTFKTAQQTSRVRELLAKLTGIADNSTDEFKRTFGEVHPNFYRSLEQQYPDLTARDKRLCGLLYLGLSSREIASITYRELRSVESARNRLRKKLNLDLTTDLTEFLQSIDT